MRPFSLQLSFSESLGKAAANGQIALLFLRLGLIVGETGNVEIKRPLKAQSTSETYSAFFCLCLDFGKQRISLLFHSSALRTVG